VVAGLVVVVVSFGVVVVGGEVVDDGLAHRKDHRIAGDLDVVAGNGLGAAAPALVRLARMRDECVALLGPVGETVVQKHYLRARAEIERGAGPEAIDEAVQQIARAAGILKGSAVADAVLKLLKA